MGVKRVDLVGESRSSSTLDSNFPTFAMEAPNINLQLYDVTGQVSIVDGIAKFNGNYSSVLLGALRGQYVKGS